MNKTKQENYERKMDSQIKCISQKLSMFDIDSNDSECLEIAEFENREGFGLEALNLEGFNNVEEILHTLDWMR